MNWELWITIWIISFVAGHLYGKYKKINWED